SPTSPSFVRTSYPLLMGTTTMDTVPKVFKFDQLSSTFQKLEFINTMATKASLLLAYQKYLAANSLKGYNPTSQVPTSEIPDAGEYRTHTDSYKYAPIFKTTYADGSDKLLIEASKGCFFGDDETDATIPHHQKGFNNTSTTPCFVIVTFS